MGVFQMIKGRIVGAGGAFFALLIVIVSVSCGGGGGGAPADTTNPDAPVLTGDSGIQPSATVAGIVTLKATASDNSGSVAKVEFYVASEPALACADDTAKPSGSAFQCSWNTTSAGNGAHELTLRAYDRANNSTASAPIPFTVQNPQLTVSKTGNGSGTVASADTAIHCGTQCTVTYAPGATVSLTATPAVGSQFDVWSGDCTGTNSQVFVTMSASKACTAAFSLITRNLSVAVQGSGSVTITPPGTVCTTSCMETYASGSTATLNAQPAPNFVFLNWSGDCTGNNPSIQVAMNADRSCTAHFAETFLLTVTRSGSGSGSVTSSPGGIACGADCDERYVSAQTVSLTAQADPGSRLDGWSGDCTGTNTTTLVGMSADKTCDARFIRTQTLTVTRTGSGTVTSSPAGINCGILCTNTFDEGTVVTLTGTPDSGATFIGWSGAGCSGTGTCAITMDAAKSVTASFSVVQRTLTVNRAGSGSGIVNSNPAGIACGGQCAAAFDQGTLVSLTASPDAGSQFSGWSGDCSGTNTTTQVTMNADKTCTATFVRRHTLTVSKSGTGNGTVTSNPAGINCGATCNATYDEGTLVTLSAAPDGTSTFAGWSGAGCAGTDTCQVTMDAAKSVTAAFNRIQFAVSVNKSGTGTGTVTSSPAGINCGATCTANFDAGTVVTLTATPAGGSTFGGWSGPCSGTGTCQFTVNANTTVGAIFNAGQVMITVTKSGSGAVASTPAGIACGRTCQMTVNAGTQVTLTPTPGPAGQSFLGWSGGGCSGTGNCVISPNSDVTITASFTNTISYTNDIQPIWDTGPGINTPCVNCHGGSGGLFLTPPASASHAQLVNVTTNACPSKKRVLPDDPQNSGLILKLTGTTCGSRMPQNGPPFFAQSTVDKIIAWIMAGAPLN
jgi:hypothetical protein